MQSIGEKIVVFVSLEKHFWHNMRRTMVGILDMDKLYSNM